VPVRIETRTPESSFREVLRHTLTEAVEGLKLGDVGDLAQIPKFGNRSRPRRRARPRCIGVPCRQRPPFGLQFFCSVSPIENIRILEDEDDDEHEDDSSTSEFRFSRAFRSS
jgi:hypothetical protein